MIGKLANIEKLIGLHYYVRSNLKTEALKIVGLKIQTGERRFRFCQHSTRCTRRHMFPCNNLPHDIRYLILKTFCAEIAHEYLVTYVRNQQSVINKLECFEAVSDLVEPAHPAASFTSFLSAIQVNREFNALSSSMFG